MDIAAAQHEVRTRFVGGFYGQLVSGILWLASASMGSWGSARAAIVTLVVGGFFIFPVTDALIRLVERKGPLSRDNALHFLGMQVAFVLPLSMPLLVPVTLHRLEWFYPAMMILLGAHYLPFVFLYGMRMFAVLAAVLVGGGMLIALYVSNSFAIGAWCTGAVLLLFAAAGRVLVRREAAPGQAPTRSPLRVSLRSLR